MKSFCLFVLLFLSKSIIAQPKTDSVVVKRRIKEIRILDAKGNVASLTKYDSIGRMTFNKLDNFGGSTYLKTSMTWFYDSHGYSIKTVSTHSSFPVPTVWVYEYDKNGNRISTRTEDGQLVFQFFYDDSNFLIKKLDYEDGIVRQTTTYEKTDNGKKIVSKIKGNFIKNRTNTTYFDDRGNEIKVMSYDGDKINFSTNSVYEKDRIIKIIYDSGDGSNYSYDAEGRLMKRQNFKMANGVETPGSFEEFIYGANGLTEAYKENIYPGAGKMRVYTYEYDYYD